MKKGLCIAGAIAIAAAGLVNTSVHAAEDPVAVACKDLPSPGAASAGVEGRAGGRQRRLRPRDVGHDGQSRRRRLRRGIHRWQPRRPVAGQPRDLRAEGQHGQLIQSCPVSALSTANLYSAVQPGGSLFGLQESNPVSTDVAYGGNPKNNGQPNDPMVGGRIGGVNVFGGGLALYNSTGKLVGAVGVSGDTSCADHNIAWRTRNNLDLDYVPRTAIISGDAGRIPTTSSTTSRRSRDRCRASAPAAGVIPTARTWRHSRPALPAVK